MTASEYNLSPISEGVAADGTRLMAADELTGLRAELARLEQENRQLQEKLNAALDGTGLCLWQGLVQTGELRVFNLQNFQAGDMAPHFDMWRAKLHPDDSERAQHHYFSHLAGKTPFYEAEYRTLSPQGEVTWLWDRGRVIEWDEDGRPLRIMGAHIDITQRKEYERRLAEQACRDALTGLLNRQGLRQSLGGEHLMGPAALLFIDLDDFKEINDLFGHVCGDRVLQRMGEWLHELAPQAVCGRYGGDEFVVYLAGAAEPAVLAALAEVLLARVQAFAPAPGSALRVGMSIGIAVWRDELAFETALELADRAMYQAKEQGKRAWHLLLV